MDPSVGDDHGDYLAPVQKVQLGSFLLPVLYNHRGREKRYSSYFGSSRIPPRLGNQFTVIFFGACFQATFYGMSRSAHHFPSTP
jgi:hypothetical protein